LAQFQNISVLLVGKRGKQNTERVDADQQPSSLRQDDGLLRRKRPLREIHMLTRGSDFQWIKKPYSSTWKKQLGSQSVVSFSWNPQIPPSLSFSVSIPLKNLMLQRVSPSHCNGTFIASICINLTRGVFIEYYVVACVNGQLNGHEVMPLPWNERHTF